MCLIDDGKSNHCRASALNCVHNSFWCFSVNTNLEIELSWGVSFVRKGKRNSVPAKCDFLS